VRSTPWTHSPPVGLCRSDIPQARAIAEAEAVPRKMLLVSCGNDCAIQYAEGDAHWHFPKAFAWLEVQHVPTFSVSLSTRLHRLFIFIKDRQG
jgi:hypothetical protein